MNIFEYAMQMEQDGETFYRDLAAKTTMPGMDRIFTMLADDEVKHRKTLQALRDAADTDMAETTVLTDAKNVFHTIDPGQLEAAADASEADLYREALDIEKKSRAFYSEKADEVDSPAQRDILQAIAAEEARHIHLLEHMIEFLSRPQSWVEDAEFNHLEEY